MNSPLPLAHDWTSSARELPLAFAQVREDPRLDMKLATMLPARAHVVMIASGGETALCLGRLPLQRLTLVDMNPAQLALTRLKWHLASEQVPHAEKLALLGHKRMDSTQRGEALTRYMQTLGLEEDVFGPLDLIAKLGPDHAGRYEVLFAVLRGKLRPHEVRLEAVLRGTEVKADIFDPEGDLGSALDEALAEVMSLPHLVALFGQEATQNPRLPFHRHFSERIRASVASRAPCTNPFLWQMLVGRFPEEATYDWLEDQRPLVAEVCYLHGRMKEVLDSMPPGSADMVHLSNILDWLNPEQAASCLVSAARVLRPGGWVILRQLNSTLEIPGLRAPFRWDVDLGRELHRLDRSFFYSAIHVAERLPS